jgi:rod shape-determining protein MreC
MNRRTARLTRRQRIAAIVLAVLAACFVTLDLGGSSLGSAHGGVRGALGSLYRGTDAVLGPVRRFVQGVPHAGSNESRVRSLQHENATLKKQLADSRADRKTATQLARLHLAATDGRYQVLPARVLAISPSGGFDWTVTLDAGASSGVKVGQSVTDGNGLVGRVLHADASTSVVLLAVDPGSGVGARDLRGGQVGVATGGGTSGFTFRPLDPRATLKVGDELSTGPSGSSSFVPGLSIGTVTAVRVSAEGTTVALVAPTVTAGELDLVGVILVGGHAGTTRVPLGPKSDLAGGR